MCVCVCVYVSPYWLDGKVNEDGWMDKCMATDGQMDGKPTKSSLSDSTSYRLLSTFLSRTSNP